MRVVDAVFKAEHLCYALATPRMAMAMKPTCINSVYDEAPHAYSTLQLLLALRGVVSG